jgi:hypothetical protein
MLDGSSERNKEKWARSNMREKEELGRSFKLLFPRLIL